MLYVSVWVNLGLSFTWLLCFTIALILVWIYFLVGFGCLCLVLDLMLVVEFLMFVLFGMLQG